MKQRNDHQVGLWTRIHDQSKVNPSLDHCLLNSGRATIPQCQLDAWLCAEKPAKESRQEIRAKRLMTAEDKVAFKGTLEIANLGRRLFEQRHSLLGM